MIVLAVILAFLLMLALLRFGVNVEYGGDSVTVSALAGPLTMRVYPVKELTEKQAEKAARKAKKAAAKRRRKKEKEKEKPKEEKPAMKPGSLKLVFKAVSAVTKALKRLRRRLLIKKLTIYYTAGGKDPTKTAMAFGASNAVFGTLLPLFDSAFRVRERDLQAAADFDAEESGVYVNAEVSLAVWEAVYIGFAFVPVLLRYVMLRDNKSKDKTM
jgi:hypothetical protein